MLKNAVEIQTIDFGIDSEIEHHKANNAVVGKDILELISVSMYVDPLTMYREYVQNAVDSIDLSVDSGLLGSSKEGRISIDLSLKGRKISIKDNGCGLGVKDFERAMLSFGNSLKRGQKARGFRGVGRFAGLAYCQKLVFRTKAKDEDIVSEISWDGRKFRHLLNDHNYQEKLEEIVSQVATVATYKARKNSNPFFEVELDRVVRTKNDVLLNEGLIYEYLAQNSPVRYSPEFGLKKELEDFLLKNGIDPGYNIILSSDFVEEKQVYRPYRDIFSLTETESDSIAGVEKFYLESVHEGLSGIGWIYKHKYKGLIPVSENIRGIRVRVGNIQIGDERVLADVFQEPRFNSWSLGEIHILDSKIIPNGRRDNFEQNVHWLEVQNQFAPHAKMIAQTCRRNSSERNAIKMFHLEKEKCLHLISVVEQGALSNAGLNDHKTKIALSLQNLEKLSTAVNISDSKRLELSKELTKIQKMAGKYTQAKLIRNNFFEGVPQHKRRAFKEVFDLIYNCSSNKIVAKSLIDKIIQTYDARN